MKFWRRIFFEWMYFGSPPWDSGVVPPEVTDFVLHHPPVEQLTWVVVQGQMPSIWQKTAGRSSGWIFRGGRFQSPDAKARSKESR